MKRKNRVIQKLALMLSLLTLVATLPVGMVSALADSVPSISYQAYVQKKEWMSKVKNGKTAGTTNQKLRLEALKINLKSGSKSMVQYNAHVSGIGWQGWVESGKMAGTTGQSKAIEAVKIKLKGSYAKKYDIYYRIHSAKAGWLGWACNGAVAGTTGMTLRAEAIQIKLVRKGSSFNKKGKAYLKVPSVSLKAYTQGNSWMKAVSWGETAGTVGEGKRLEALKITLKDYDGNSGISYRAHVSKQGWQGWKSSGKKAGTTGKSRAIEAVQIKLNDNLGKFFDVYYRMHVQKKGWLGWAKNGDIAGTTGLGLRAEAIQIVLVNKDKAFDAGGIAYFNEKNQVAHSVDEAINWCYSMVGQQIGTGECVELIKAYYQYLGVTPMYGNAIDYALKDEMLPDGWTRVQGGIPQRGDIIIYYGTANNDNCGHVGIYESDYSNFHQNEGGKRWVHRVTDWRYDKGHDPYWGYIRPSF